MPGKEVEAILQILQMLGEILTKRRH